MGLNSWPYSEKFTMIKRIPVLFLCILFVSFIQATDQEPKKSFRSLVEPIIKRIKALANKRDKSADIPFIVAIAGISEGGKSHFAERLSELLEEENIRTIILHLDDFMEKELIQGATYHPHLDYKKAHEVIRKILRGATRIRKRTWVNEEGQEPYKIEEEMCLENVDLVLFEGEFTLCDASSYDYDFVKYSSLGIFMDASDEDILRWNWDRKRAIKAATMQRF